MYGDQGACIAGCGAGTDGDTGGVCAIVSIRERRGKPFMVYRTKRYHNIKISEFYFFSTLMATVSIFLWKKDSL